MPASERYSITWLWRDRAGERRQTRVNCLEGEHPRDPGAYEKTRVRAIEAGYPGHRGGRYNYFVDDFHAWLRRTFGPPCECHICSLWATGQSVSHG